VRACVSRLSEELSLSQLIRRLAAPSPRQHLAPYTTSNSSNITNSQPPPPRRAIETHSPPERTSEDNSTQPTSLPSKELRIRPSPTPRCPPLKNHLGAVGLPTLEPPSAYFSLRVYPSSFSSTHSTAGPHPLWPVPLARTVATELLRGLLQRPRWGTIPHQPARSLLCQISSAQ
jgi:hypothetical protein